MTYQRAPGAFARRTPRSLVVLAARSREPIRISGSAVEIWDMLAGPKLADDLLTEVARRVGVAPDAVAADVVAALDVLIEAGAVDVVP